MKDQAFHLAPNDRSTAEKIYDVFKKANKLKGFVFPFITFSIFFGIMTFVLGGARHVEAIPHWLHPLSATALVLVSLVSQPFVSRSIHKNINFLNEVSTLLGEE